MSLDELLKRLIDGKEGYCTNVKTGIVNYNSAVKSIAELALKKSKKYNITFGEIAKRANVSSDAVSSFMRGKTIPNIVTVIVVARVVNALADVKVRQQGYKLDATSMKK